MTVEIPLTRGAVAVVDDDDADAVLACGSWNLHRGGRRRDSFYAVRHDNSDPKRRVIRMHSFITGLAFVDHRDGDGLNNRRDNLRGATKTQNGHNATLRIDNTSGYKGVCWSRRRNRWIVHIVFLGKSKYVGTFVNIIDAAMAYDRAAIDMFGDFACVNFPAPGVRSVRSPLIACAIATPNPEAPHA